MDTFKLLFIVLSSLVAGILFDRAYLGRSRKSSRKPTNPVPDSLPKLTEQSERILKLYLQEWQVIIESQMHFNELILKFRSITLTALGTLVGATIAIKKLTGIQPDDYHFLLLVIGSLWAAAFLIDVFYYNRLLIGAVNQAAKFDDSPLAQSVGLFGLTSCISNHVRPPTSQLLVFLYYCLPVFVTTVLIFYFN
jgi:hypothetical protein